MRPSPGAAVVDLATRRRREDNVIESITLVFGDVNYGTIPVRIPYAPGKPIRLLLAPSAAGDPAAALAGRLDALLTDDESVAAELQAVR